MGGAERVARCPANDAGPGGRTRRVGGGPDPGGARGLPARARERGLSRLVPPWEPWWAGAAAAGLGLSAAGTRIVQDAARSGEGACIKPHSFKKTMQSAFLL